MRFLLLTMTDCARLLTKSTRGTFIFQRFPIDTTVGDSGSPERRFTAAVFKLEESGNKDKDLNLITELKTVGQSEPGTFGRSAGDLLEKLYINLRADTTMNHIFEPAPMTSEGHRIHRPLTDI